MVALATAFIVLSPQLNPGAFKAAGTQAGASAGVGAGTSFNQGFNKGTTGMFKGLRTQFAGAANILVPAAIVGAVAKIGQIGMAYEDNLNIFQAVTKATGVQMDQVAAKARQLGADVTLPGVSAAGAASAMTELSKAGFSVQQSMDAARGTLELARVSGLGEADAAIITANAVNAFGIAAADTTKVVDQLAAASNSSSVDIHDVELAFRQASSVFSSFQGAVVGPQEAVTELSTAIAILGNNGIRGSDAGTSLKQMLLQLTGPTERAKTVMAELALRAAGANVSLEQQVNIIQGSKSVRDKTLKAIRLENQALGDQGDIAYTSAGQMRSLPEIIDLVTRGTKGMTQEQRNAAITQIFGADATRSIIALMKGGLPVYEKQRVAVLQQGAAADFAAAKNKGLRGSLDNVRSQLENIAIELYNTVRGPLRDAFNGLANALQGVPKDIAAVTKFVRENSDELKLFAKVVGIVALSFVAYRTAITLAIATTKAFLVLQSVFEFVQLAVQLRSLSGAWSALSLSMGSGNAKLATATANLKQMGPAGVTAAAGMQKTVTAAAKLTVVLAALEVSSIVFDKLAEKSVNVDRLTDSLVNLAQTGKVSGELADDFGKDMEGLGLNAQIANSGVFGFINSVEDSIPILGSAARSISNFGGRIAVGTDFTTARKQMAGLDESLSTFITNTKDARVAGDLWNKILLQSNLNTDELAKLLPNSYKGLAELQKQAHAVTPALSGAAQAQVDLKQQTKLAQGASKGQVDSLKDLNDALRAMYDPAFAFIDAQKKVRDAQKAVTKAINDSGKNSQEARDATLDLASAALDLQEKASKLAVGFDGKLTPAFKSTLKAAKLTDGQIAVVAKQFANAKKAADKYDGKYKADTSAPGAVKANKEITTAHKAAVEFAGPYAAYMSTPGGKEATAQALKAWNNLKGYDGNWVANIKTTGYAKVANELRHLLAAQQAAKDNVSVNEANRELGHFFATGGKVPGFSPTATSDNIPAWLTAGEFVQPVSAVNYYGAPFMEALRKKTIPRAEAAAIAAYKMGGSVRSPKGYATGGTIQLPFPTDVSKTKIPEVAFPGPIVGGGGTLPWIIKAVHSAFPGLRLISGYRPGARTLSGNQSYHAIHRAADWPASHALAVWWNQHYKKITKEFISPWNNLNIHNGARHAYTGAIYRQHSGGNAHDHIAVAKGGLIPPVKLFDNGGYWPSGTLGANMSGRTEYVSPSGRGGRGVVNNVTVNVNSTNASPEEIAAAVSRELGRQTDLYARSSW